MFNPLFERCCDSDGLAVIKLRLESMGSVVMSLQQQQLDLVIIKRRK